MKSLAINLRNLGPFSRPASPPHCSDTLRQYANLPVLCLPGKYRFRLVLFAAGLLGLLTSAHGIVLNEALAVNQKAVERGHDFPDYVELFNPTSIPVDISGWNLTDDPANPRRFVFPDGTLIPAGSYMLVWCDQDFDKPGLHAGFGLGSDGEQIILYGPDGLTAVDSVVFGLQIPDHAISRVPDGTGPWTLSEPTPLAANRMETTASPIYVRINEWLARPASGDDWLELYNTHMQPVALGGLVLTDQDTAWPENRPIPDLSFISGHGFAVLQATGLEKTDADHLDFKLSGTGETVRMLDATCSILIDEITFGIQSIDVSEGRAPDGSDHIIAFPAGASTSGSPNVMILTTVAISEVLTHSDPPWEDAIELQNLTASPINLSYWWLSDEASEPRKYAIPNGTYLPAAGYLVFYESQFGAGPSGFQLDSAEGDEVFLSAGNMNGELTGQQTSMQIGPLLNGVSAGRYQTSIGVDIAPLSWPTFGVNHPVSANEFRQGKGAANAPPRVGQVVISEILFQPLAQGFDEPFIELHNRDTIPAPLYDPAYPTNCWRINEGITFDFRPNTPIPAQGFLLVVDFDPTNEPARLAAFCDHYDVPADTPVVGPYGGRLNQLGEMIALAQPDKPEGTNDHHAGLVPYFVTEQIHYLPNTPWPAGTAGTGQSLQRLDPAAYGNDPTNWVAAPPTAGRAFLPDSDQDGLPDNWETTYGLDPRNAEDAEEDADEDGANNRAEYLAGTHPGDAQSVFRLLSLRRESGGWFLYFNAASGQSYTLETQSHLEAAWEMLSRISPDEPLVRLWIPLPYPDPAQSFFRVRCTVCP